MKAYLEAGEVERIEKEATCLRDRLLVHFLYRSGCRVGEVVALTIEDVDLAQSSVRIVHLKMRLKLSCPGCEARLGASHIFCPKCGHEVRESVASQKEHRRYRVLPLDSETVRLLKEYINRDGPVERKGKKMIFGINRHRAWQIVKECARKTGLPKLINPETGKVHNVSPHKLRDAFAIYAMKLDDSGDGMRLLQEHLGHQNFNTTAKYRKVAGEELKAWYSRLWDKKDGQGGAKA